MIFGRCDNISLAIKKVTCYSSGFLLNILKQKQKVPTFPLFVGSNSSKKYYKIIFVETLFKKKKYMVIKMFRLYGI